MMSIVVSSFLTNKTHLGTGSHKYTGINFLAFRELKIYIHFRPAEHKFFSERVIGSEPPFQKSSKPVVATAGTGFFRHRFLRGLSWDRLLHRQNRWPYPAQIARAAIRFTIAANNRRVS
jgi:hypothetical protein